MNFPFTSPSLAILAITFTCLYYSKKVKSIYLKLFTHTTFIILAFGLMSHLAPGFKNFLIFDKIQLSNDSLPFTMYLNFDKPFLALFIFSLFGFGEKILNLKNILLFSLQTWLLCSTVLIGLALFVGYIRVDIKFPTETWIWTLNNILLVCTAEEAFFRRYLQGGLAKMMQKINGGAHLALMISAICFGLAHFKGGITYVLISTIAGLFYGYAYMKTQRTEAAILTHFGLNCTHFFFFSYPALLK